MWLLGPGSNLRPSAQQHAIATTLPAGSGPQHLADYSSYFHISLRDYLSTRLWHLDSCHPVTEYREPPRVVLLVQVFIKRNVATRSMNAPKSWLRHIIFAKLLTLESSEGWGQEFELPVQSGFKQSRCTRRMSRCHRASCSHAHSGSISLYKCCTFWQCMSLTDRQKIKILEKHAYKWLHITDIHVVQWLWMSVLMQQNGTGSGKDC